MKAPPRKLYRIRRGSNTALSVVQRAPCRVRGPIRLRAVRVGATLRAMRFVTFALGLLGLVACSTPGKDRWQDVSSPATVRPALAAIQTRDYKVIWLGGQRLRVEDARGNAVADGVTTADLRRIDPFLHAACTNATAGAYLDARLDDPGAARP